MSKKYPLSPFYTLEFDSVQEPILSTSFRQDEALYFVQVYGDQSHMTIGRIYLLRKHAKGKWDMSPQIVYPALKAKTIPLSI